MRAWDRFLASSGYPGAAPRHAHNAVIDVARKRLLRNYRTVVRLGRETHSDSPAETLHRLRIKCKKLRYLMEFFASLFPDEKVNALETHLKKLQEHLGRHQDLWVQEKELAGFADRCPCDARQGRRTLMAVGCLLGVFEKERGELRQRFAATFSEVASDSARREFERMLTN